MPFPIPQSALKVITVLKVATNLYHVTQELYLVEMATQISLIVHHVLLEITVLQTAPRMVMLLSLKQGFSVVFSDRLFVTRYSKRYLF